MKFFSRISTATEKISQYFIYVVLAMMMMIIITVFARYFLRISFMWGPPISRQLWGLFILFAGSYTMLVNRHLKIEILYDRFSPKVQFISRLVNFIGFLLTMIIFIWQSGKIAMTSLSILEQSASSAPKYPVYPMKTVIPVLCILFLLQGIASFVFGEKKENTE